MGAWLNTENVRAEINLKDIYLHLYFNVFFYSKTVIIMENLYGSHTNTDHRRTIFFT